MYPYEVLWHAEGGRTVTIQRGERETCVTVMHIIRNRSQKDGRRAILTLERTEL